MGVRGWTKIAKDKDALKLILKEARVLHGPLEPVDRQTSVIPFTIQRNNLEEFSREFGTDRLSYTASDFHRPWF
jgi:hypothetical protein